MFHNLSRKSNPCKKINLFYLNQNYHVISNKIIRINLYYFRNTLVVSNGWSYGYNF